MTLAYQGLVWLAFALLPFSRQFGELSLLGRRHEAGAATRAGRQGATTKRPAALLRRQSDTSTHTSTNTNANANTNAAATAAGYVPLEDEEEGDDAVAAAAGGAAGGAAGAASDFAAAADMHRR